MSERTRTYDISDVGEFRFWTGEMSGIEIKCTYCNPDPRRSEETCSWQGICKRETRKCLCEDNYFGPRCEYRGPCTEVVMYESFRGSIYATRESFPKSFQMIYNGGDSWMWMGSPVYGQQETSRYMFFDGMYWNVIEGEFNNTYDLVSNLKTT